jgi:hypothetical protein
MKYIVRLTLGLLISSSLVVLGCTEPNPGYYTGDGASWLGDWGGYGTDFRYGSDWLPLPDGGGPIVDTLNPLPDGQVIPPDSEPVYCSSDSQCDDGLWCTEDSCDGVRCVSTHSTGCLIDGQCYANFKPNPANPCQQCSEAYPTSWQGIGDNIPCPDDGIECTKDICYAGVCAHLLQEGNCLVGSACYGEGNVGQCEECIPSLSASTLTPTNGKACAPSSPDKIAGMCVDSICKGWVEAHIDPDPGNSTSSTLKTVAFVAADNTFWAGGAYRDSSQGQWGDYSGFLVRLDPATMSTPNVKTVDAEVVDMHHNLAVDGDNGYYHFSNGKWQDVDVLKKTSRDRVWGVSLNTNEEVYFLAGEDKDNTAPLYRCNFTVSSQKMNCAGFQTSYGGQDLGPIWGFLDPSGNGHISLWTAATGQYDDIYAYQSASNLWSPKAPLGCTDANGTVCNLSINGQDFKGVYGTGPSDLWLVGENGVILHYNGGSWTTISSGLVEQAYYDLIDVFADAKLVTIVARVQWQGGQTVALFNYDRALQRWHGPIELKVALSWQESTDVNAMAGSSYDNLWMVGTDLEWLPSPAQRAWALRLE